MPASPQEGSPIALETTPRPSRLNTPRGPRGPWVIAAVFVLSRLIVLARNGPLGFVPRDAGGWHVIDPALLRERLAESLFYLHAQPPLYNLLLGLVVKTCPGFEALALQGLYTALGAAVAWGLYRLMTALGVSSRLSTGLVVAYLVSPASMLYETLFSYDHLNMALVVLSAVLLHRYLERRTAPSGLAFFSCLTALALIRPIFHLGWVALVVAAVAVLARRWELPARRALAVAVLPTLLVPALYLKNAVVFHHFAASTWMGMNAARITLMMVPLEERAALADAGKLSPLARSVPFRPLGEYPAAYRAVAPTGIPVLDRPEAGPGGQPNFNHLAYIAIADQFQRDDVAIVRERPSAYLKGLAWALVCYFQTAETNYFLWGPAARLEPWSSLYQGVVDGRWLPHGLAARWGSPGMREAVDTQVTSVGVWLLVALPLAFAVGLRRLRRPAASDTPAGRAVLAYMLATIAFVSLVGNALEAGENFRFRFLVDPFFLVLAGLTVQALLTRWRQTRERATQGATWK